MNEPVGAAAVPIFDALYLDMNGIIHNCTHGNDPSTKLTETEMVLRIFNYLDKLVQIVKPQQLLFMAIDGAPPARVSPSRPACSTLSYVATTAASCCSACVLVCYTVDEHRCAMDYAGAACDK